jgi:site-specific DNA-methyltransferase (adenine-specific)/modification methylase
MLMRNYLIESNNQKKFDCCITSPPYNMNLRVRDGRYISRSSKGDNYNEFSKKYKNFNDDLPMEDYFIFLDNTLDRLLKLCNLVFFNIQAITGNKVALFQVLGKYADKLKEVIIWDKMRSQPAMHENILNSQFEFIFVFDSDKPYNRAFDFTGFDRGTETNIWQIPTEQNKFNKASFPEALVARILRNFTKENEIIFDPFMGSGTTGIVCSRMKRQFVGCEIDEEMFKIAKQRIENQEINRRLF